LHWLKESQRSTSTASKNALKSTCDEDKKSASFGGGSRDKSQALPRTSTSLQALTEQKVQAAPRGKAREDEDWRSILSPRQA